MAVKKTGKNQIQVEVEIPDLNIPAAEESTSDGEVQETSVESVEVPSSTIDTIPTEGAVIVDFESLDVKEDNIPVPPEGKVRIRMRVDHHCVIAMERYDFKAGQCYLVPQNVKNIMNRMGYLAPL